jgi:hypothetical protein
MVVLRSTLVFILLFYAATNNVFADSCWHAAAERYGIHETILRAIALTESAMDSQAISPDLSHPVVARASIVCFTAVPLRGKKEGLNPNLF